MNAATLIEENNRRREQLSAENEAYYSDMLIYIRLQLSLSEQQAEEVLMEMLDHLLDGQREGKTAKDIFVDDPKAYADELIKHLPQEEKRAVIPFVSGIIVNILSWILIIRGILFLVISPFKEVDTMIYLYSVIALGLLIACIVLGGVWYIFRLIKHSLFQQHSSDKKIMLKAGIFGAISMALIILTSTFIPSTGPSIHFPWWMSLISGGVLWLIHIVYKK